MITGNGNLDAPSKTNANSAISCNEMAKLLVSHCFNDLSAEGRCDVEQHLADCETCRLQRRALELAFGADLPARLSNEAARLPTVQCEGIQGIRSITRLMVSSNFPKRLGFTFNTIAVMATTANTKMR